MIGFNGGAERIFEIHAGATDPAIRDLSVPIADIIAAHAAALGALAPAQTYKGTSSSGGSDRDLVDGAIGRSDHASFHTHGIPRSSFPRTSSSIRRASRGATRTPTTITRRTR